MNRFSQYITSHYASWLQCLITSPILNGFSSNLLQWIGIRNDNPIVFFLYFYVKYWAHKMQNTSKMRPISMFLYISPQNHVPFLSDHLKSLENTQESMLYIFGVSPCNIPPTISKIYPQRRGRFCFAHISATNDRIAMPLFASESCKSYLSNDTKTVLIEPPSAHQMSIYFYSRKTSILIVADPKPRRFFRLFFWIRALNHSFPTTPYASHNTRYSRCYSCEDSRRTIAFLSSFRNRFARLYLHWKALFNSFRTHYNMCINSQKCALYFQF
jgi:hypothetical protein